MSFHFTLDKFRRTTTENNIMIFQKELWTKQNKVFEITLFLS